MTNGSRLLQRIADLTIPGRAIVYPKLIFAFLVIAWPLNIFVFGQPPLDSQGAFIGNDFVAFYTGAKLWMNGQSHNLYDAQTQQAFQLNLVNHLVDSPVLEKKYKLFTPFINPPISILLYLPFSRGGYSSGLTAWWLFTSFCLGVSIHLMHKYIPGLDRWRNGQLWEITLLFFPSLAWIIYGQATTIIFCIWTTCYVLLRLRREFWAGFTLSFLVFKPQLALSFALPLIVSFRMRALLGGIVGLGCWAGLTFVIFPQELIVYQQQVKTIMELLRDESYPSWGIHSFYGFSNLAVYPIAPALADFITSGLSLLGLLFCGVIWWKAEWNPASADWNTRLAVTIPVCLLLAVQLYLYDLMLLLFPYFLIMSQKRYWTNPGNKYLDGGAVLAWTSLVYCACFLSSYFVKAQQVVFKAIHLPPLGLQLSVLCIIGWCWAVWKHHKDTYLQK